MNGYYRRRVKRLIAVYIGAIAVVLAADGVRAVLWH